MMQEGNQILSTVKSLIRFTQTNGCLLNKAGFGSPKIIPHFWCFDHWPSYLWSNWFWVRTGRLYVFLVYRTIVGMTSYTRREHICRAALESTCFMVKDVSSVVTIITDVLYHNYSTSVTKWIKCSYLYIRWNSASSVG